MRHLQSRYGLVVLLTALYLTGCIWIRGVLRRASVPSLPASSCVIQALESSQCVTNVRHEARTGGRTLTLTGLKPPDTLHYYFYDFQGVSANLYFEKNYKGKVKFYQAYTSANTP